MGRYSRALYGDGKYGLDLRSEHSVEPMVATLEVDPNIETTPTRRGGSSFTDSYGRSVYDRVQISWMAPLNVQRFVLLRSNIGYPTGPTDPYAARLVDTADPELPAPVNVHRYEGDPYGRTRVGHLDNFVEQGREYFYTAWSMTGDESNDTDEWHLSGRAMVTTSADHGTLDTLKLTLPPYMWNRYAGAGTGVAVLDDPDDENTMTKWMQSVSWELDKIMTKADLLRKVWDPQYTPAVLLDEATDMFGLPNEPALGDRAARALLSNAADISRDRGTLNAIGLLVESLSGFKVDIDVGTNMLASTEESSFEGLMLDEDGKVATGTGRWHIDGANLTRITGDPANADVKIARDPNPEEPVKPTTRFGLGLDLHFPEAGMSMSLGERIRVKHLKTGDKVGVITTAWPHGLEAGDKIRARFPVLSSSAYEIDSLFPIDDFTLQIEVPEGLEDNDFDVDNGWLEGGPIPVYQGVPIVPGEPYSLVGMFQGPSSSTVELTMRYWSRTGELLGSTTATPEFALRPDVWSRINSSGSAPEGAASATLLIKGNVTGVDSIMVRHGGTRYDGVQSDGSVIPYTSDTPYRGSISYEFEDAQLLTLTFDTASTPTGGKIPFTIRADMAQVLRERMTDILTTYLPIGTAFQLKGLEAYSYDV